MRKPVSVSAKAATEDTKQPGRGAAQRNIIVSAAGRERPAKPLSSCVISYVDCATKKAEVVKLNPGDTFKYGDWDAKRKVCLKKEYKCPK